MPHKHKPRKRPPAKGQPREKDVGCVSHFLDSGSFSLWTKAAKYAKAKPGRGKWDYYDTKSHWRYVDKYAAFIKRYSYGIDLYANVDVIPNPELTWRNQQYLEKQHGLSPIPVVHYRTDFKWLRFYMDHGYDLIALGGLVGSTGTDSCISWLDEAFRIVCKTPDSCPKVKIHGFGVTVFELLLRYPWYSVDSTSWTMVGAYGGILVPHRRGGKWIFTEPPYVMKVSDDSPDKGKRGKHFHNISPAEKKLIQDWLEYIDIPMGKLDKDGGILEFGCLTRHTERKCANILFFELFRKSLPDYPWPYHPRKRKGMGLI